MGYLPNSDADRRAMLEAVGADSPRDLFRSVPEHLLEHGAVLPPALGEQELVEELGALAGANTPMGTLPSFLGGGVYHRFIPAIVRATIARPEFYTAYTPYQAEASQGTLQTIFEFQSMLCAITGMDVCNASMYDGATAAAEAALLAVAHTGRHRVLVSAGIHPETLAVLRTYGAGRGMAVDVAPLTAGRTAGDLTGLLTGDHAALLVAQPTWLGTVEDLAPLCDAAHAAGALAVVMVDPLAATVLIAPGDAGADVVVGECQPLGIPASFGGPHCGFVAVTTPLVRRMPGRLVGMTVDAAGRRAYSLTLQTREQHIRRERATSNICTNHALMALAATTYMARMGAVGMRRVVELSAQRAHHLVDRLLELDGIELVNGDTPWLFEAALRLPGDVNAFVREMRAAGILAGLAAGRLDPDRRDQLLVCCTEMTPAAAIDTYVERAAALLRTPAGAHR